MIILCRKKQPKDITLWYKWFAWYPVRVNDNECRWLEYVERQEIEKTYATYDDWTRYKYRVIYQCNGWCGEQECKEFKGKCKRTK